MRTPHAGYVIMPRFGKHVRFRGSLYHGVLEQSRSNVSPPRRGPDRLALVVTYWAAPLQRIARFPRDRMAHMLAQHGRRTDDAKLQVAWQSLAPLNPAPWTPLSRRHTADCTADADGVVFAADSDVDHPQTQPLRDAVTDGTFVLRLPAPLEPDASVYVRDVKLSLRPGSPSHSSPAVSHT